MNVESAICYKVDDFCDFLLAGAPNPSHKRFNLRPNCNFSKYLQGKTKFQFKKNNKVFKAKAKLKCLFVEGVGNLPRLNN